MMTLHDITVRTIIDLPAEQMRKLALLCRREKISRAEAVRRAVDLMLRENRGDALQAFFGASKTRGDVSKHLRRLRRDWSAQS